MPSCRICNNVAGNQAFVVRETMFGFCDRFDYFECAACGCLQIAEIPPDLLKYYPDGYYAFRDPSALDLLKRALQGRWIAQAMGRRDFIGRRLPNRFGAPRIVDWLKRSGVNFDDAIIDVGCGRGKLLLQLRSAGFRNLSGIDPYIAHDFAYGDGLRLRKATLDQLTGRYELVILNHSFEHMPDPVQALEDVRRVLGRGGCLLIRTPLAGCYAWKTYGTDWTQLDAPRHLHIHTVASIGILAERVGLDLSETIYDSTSLQFWGSEQNQQGIPLMDKRSWQIDPKASLFSAEDHRNFEAKAIELNAEKEGDQASLYLRPAD